MFGGWLDGLMFLVAVATIALVGWWFSLDVNRVFDVPKAYALKTGGGLLLVLWVGLAFTRGWPTRSLRLFFGPALAFVLAVAASTALSIDPWMSYAGVYERQFGLQGILACFGLFLTTATALRSRRGALVALGALAVVGGVIGAYAWLQSTGHDPYGFFKKPHNKVYATLGNATFAGNALALVFPMSTVLAAAAVAKVLSGTNLSKAFGADSVKLAPFFGLAGGCLGLIVVRYFALDTAELDVWHAFWASPLAWTSEGLRAVVSSDTFAKCALGFIAGALAGVARLTKHAVTAVPSTDVAPGASPAVDRTEGLKLLAWVVVGLVAAVVLLVVPSYFAAVDPGLTEVARITRFKVTAGIAVTGSIIAFMFGSYGPESTRVESRSTQRVFDALLAGALVAFALGILVGLYTTRTRGAWVGSAVSVAAATLLFPQLFADEPRRMARFRIAGLSALAAGVLGVTAFVQLQPDHVFSRTILSIPHAFNPEKTVYGQGQGTRRYLWVESPLVLLDHKATLDRKAKDAADVREHVKGQPRGEEVATGSATMLRQALVWPFGIGFETYRYAFMSHKSKKLEALDPMTNHDNPHNNYLYILATCGLAGLLTYLWLLFTVVRAAWRAFAVIERGPDGAPTRDRFERGIAFGVLASFVSYSVYSIAGFDSVACSVFLFFFLGAAATFLAPAEDAKDEELGVAAKAGALGRLPVPATLVGPVAIACAVLGLHTMYRAHVTRSAEQTFVADGSTLDDRIDAIQRAIKLNPNESYYQQQLGSMYGDMARQLRRAAQQTADVAKQRPYLDRANEKINDAEEAIYAALPHAWAPENIFISLFTLYYQRGQLAAAEAALERALEHSPHLGPVRANLAVLKVERGAFKEAMADVEWVLEVEPNNTLALKTGGRAALGLGDYARARALLEGAKTREPNDKQVLAALEELTRKTSTTATASSPAP